MQTFLPYPEFETSAKVLDRQRLGKQRVEALQILRSLVLGGGWANHPATKMWCGYEQALVLYALATIDEWKSRGYKDTCKDKILDLVNPIDPVMPPWLGDRSFHASHRSNLLRKSPSHYGQFGWSEPSDLPYVWPQCVS